VALTWPIVLAVLCGAVMHAGWNALVKSSGDKEVDTALMHFVGSVVALPMLLLVGPPPPVAWPYIGASVAIHIAYYITLAGAYKHGDLGLTYPIMRGSAPLLVALGSSAVLGESLSPLAWAGVLGVTFGVALVGLAHPGEQLSPGRSEDSCSPQGPRRGPFVALGADAVLRGRGSTYTALHHRRAMGFALANACVIAMYTFVDGSGVRTAVAAGHSALTYVLMLFVLDGIPYPGLVWLRRDAAGRRAILAYARIRWPLAAVGGAASIGSYAIALWAMTRAPVASVSALRETSILFATVLGVWLLKEPFGAQRALGAVVIVGGVVALRFG
jgi:drug/metabolite transporter (DMT)-like permease